MAAPSLDFWFDFASTYSYPAIMRVGALARREAVAVNFRPFLLGPIFKTQGWSTSPFNLFPAKGRHMWRDLERTCAGLGLAFRRPHPFPQSSYLRGGLRWSVSTRAGEMIFAARSSMPSLPKDAVSTSQKPCAAFLPACRPMPPRCSKRRRPLRSKTGCARKQPRRKSSIFSAPQVFVLPTANSSGGNDRLEAALAWAKRGR
jgi:hypothetical protein